MWKSFLCFATFAYFAPLRETGLFIHGIIHRFQGRGLYLGLGHPRCPAKDVGHAQAHGRGQGPFGTHPVSKITDGPALQNVYSFSTISLCFFLLVQHVARSGTTTGDKPSSS
jgi:hypothetical protein